MMRMRLLLIVLCLVSAVCAGEDRAVAFSVCRHLVVFPIQLNGAGPYPFAIDLGLQRVVLGSEVAKSLNLDPRSDDAEGAAVAMLDSIQLGGVEAKDKQALVMDLSGFERTLGQPVAGLFDPREVVAEIGLDFASNTASVRGSNGALLDPAVPGVTAFRYNDRGEPTVSAVINGSSVRAFVVDTTFDGTVMIPLASLREMGLLQEGTPRIETLTPPTADGIPSAVSGIQIRLKSIRMGQAEIMDPVCTVGSEGSTMRIGLGFLRRFRVAVNFEKKLLKLEYFQPPPLRERPVIGVGLVPDAFDGQRWTVMVAAGSAAAEAGFMSGDTLVSVGEKDAAGLGHDALVTLLSIPEGGKVVIAAQHAGGEAVKAELGSRKLL